MAAFNAPVNNGNVQQYVSDVAQKKNMLGNSALGKDAFMQLLCTQMQYQDPLNPSSDTDFIAQLASFSSLEQMQNLNTSFTKSQAFSLIGQEVRVSEDNEDGYIQGKIDYVTVSNGKTYFSIGDELYPVDKLLTVVDQEFMAQQKAPYIEEQAFHFEQDKSSNISIKVNLGKDECAASSFAVLVNGEVVDKKYLGFDDKANMVTISKDVFSELDPGNYKVMFAFDDKLQTMVSDKVSVTVSGEKSETNSEP